MSHAADGPAGKPLQRFLAEPDPYLDLESRVAFDMVEGLRRILQLHNAVELSSLAGALGLNAARLPQHLVEDVLDYVRCHARPGGKLSAERNCREVLSMVWEGVLFEYLRSVGQPLRPSQIDPRAFVFRFWRRRAAEEDQRAFVPYYAERRVRAALETSSTRAPDLHTILEDIDRREARVKDIEAVMRREQDYRHILSFLSRSKELRDAEAKHRTYLIEEVERLRAERGHYERSHQLMELQLEELEDRADGVQQQYVTRLARAEASCAMLGATAGQTFASNVALARRMTAFAATEAPRVSGNQESHEDAGEADARSESGDDGETRSATGSDGPPSTLATATAGVASEVPNGGAESLIDAFAAVLHKFDGDILERNDAIQACRRDVVVLRQQLRETFTTLAEERRRAFGAESRLAAHTAAAHAVLDAQATAVADLTTRDTFHYEGAALAAADVNALCKRLREAAPRIEKLLVAPDPAVRDVGWSIFVGLGLAEAPDDHNQMRDRVAMHFEEERSRWVAMVIPEKPRGTARSRAAKAARKPQSRGRGRTGVRSVSPPSRGKAKASQRQSSGAPSSRGASRGRSKKENPDGDVASPKKNAEPGADDVKKRAPAKGSPNRSPKARRPKSKENTSAGPVQRGKTSRDPEASAKASKATRAAGTKKR